MTTGLYFSSLFNGVVHGHSQSSFYMRSRKRKRDNDTQSHNAEEPSDSARQSAVPEQQSDTEAEAALHSVDIQTDSEKNPDPRVWSQPVTSKSIATSILELKLADLKPPVCLGPNSHTRNLLGTSQSGLKHQHLAVLTAIMHKCLLKGDYLRAGRAWGILLRAEIHGRPPELRSNGLWSLGADIILQSDAKATIVPQGHTEDPEWDATLYTGENCENLHSHLTTPYSTQTDFKQAKAYFERLILQYPWRKWLRNSISSLHFYPVMFGLWISVVQGQQRDALARLFDGSDDSGEDPNDMSDKIEVSYQAKTDAIRLSTLDSAVEIYDDLQKLLESFPYSDCASLWTLKGKVSLWLSDLCLTQPTEPLSFGTVESSKRIATLSDGDSTRSTVYDGSIEGRQVEGDRRQIFEEHVMYKEEAAKAFETARKFQKRPGDWTQDFSADDDTMQVQQET